MRTHLFIARGVRYVLTRCDRLFAFSEDQGKLEGKRTSHTSLLTQRTIKDLPRGGFAPFSSKVYEHLNNTRTGLIVSFKHSGRIAYDRFYWREKKINNKSRVVLIREKKQGSKWSLTDCCNLPCATTINRSFVRSLFHLPF